MTYIKRCMKESLNRIVSILFLISMGGCKESLKFHLVELHKKNYQIDKDGWVKTRYWKTDEETFFHLQKQIADTSIHLYFSCFSHQDTPYYAIDGFIKSFRENGLYFEMELCNADTLYFFEDKFRPLNDTPGVSPNFRGFRFIKGKYYYLYKRGKYNMGQRDYFERNRDSLIMISGNDLPDLPEIRSISIDTIQLPTPTLFPSN